MIFIDTEILNKPSVIDKLPNADSYDYAGAQNKFLESELESCNSDYCMVIGHHPILSNGIYGPTPAIVEQVMPITEKHKIGLNSSSFVRNFRTSVI